MTSVPPANLDTSYLGIAPFLRMSIAGVNLLPIAQEMLARAQQDSGNTELWMNLSVVMQCIGQRDIGLAMQQEALTQRRLYSLDALAQPAKLRMLILMAPGDIAENTPLDCLLEGCDVDLIHYYVSHDDPLPHPVPDHDILMVAMSESDRNHAIFALLEQSLADWPKPVVNAPQYIPATGRDTASMLLQNVPGLHIPLTVRIARSDLQDIASGKTSLSGFLPEGNFPIILRPFGSQAGRDLDRLYGPEEIVSYLAKVDATEFFLSAFIDYSGQDGLFRKYRVALIDGQPYACHMAVSSNWMVHYVNAGMYEDAQKRAEELDFMEHFDKFAYRHQAALNAIYQRTKLDYLCIDCAESHDGELLIFEIDHTMVVHAMDPEDLFPYKQLHMRKVQQAFRDFLLRLSS